MKIGTEMKLLQDTGTLKLGQKYSIKTKVSFLLTGNKLFINLLYSLFLFFQQIKVSQIHLVDPAEETNYVCFVKHCKNNI